jgi:hypothetical protein
MLKPVEQETSAPQISVVVNWIADLNRRMPAREE